MADAPRTAAELAELLRPLLPGYRVWDSGDGYVATAAPGQVGATIRSIHDPVLLLAVDLAACRRERDRYEAAWREAVAREAAGSAQGPVSEDEAARRLR